MTPAEFHVLVLEDFEKSYGLPFADLLKQVNDCMDVPPKFCIDHGFRSRYWSRALDEESDRETLVPASLLFQIEVRNTFSCDLRKIMRTLRQGERWATKLRERRRWNHKRRNR